MARSRLIRPLLAALIACSALLPGAAHSATRPIGDVQTFAQIPYPGQGGGIGVNNGTVYVDTFGFVVRPTNPSDDIFEFRLSNGQAAQPAPVLVPRSRPVAIMGLSGEAFDEQGRLYVVDMNARIMRIDPVTGSQDVYATFPAGAGGPFSTMPLDMVFDRNGYAYVTDIAGAPIIWRVPPGGGVAEPWFVDPRIAGVYTEGGGGIRIDASGTTLYFSVIGSLYPETAGHGVLFTLPIADPTDAALKVFHLYESPVESPPLGAGGLGMDFGPSGKLYVALPGTNQISVLLPDGSEEQRFPLPTSPQFVAVAGNGSLLVTTWGDFNAGPWPVLDVFVNDPPAA